MAYKKNKADVDREQQYQTESDADTMMRHQEITADPERHQRATDHLEKKMQQTQGAHKAARKQLEKKTKGRLKKVFGGDKGETFGNEKDKETAEAEKIVNTNE